ncbi:hypothetical protein D9M69_688540 [compost metagenome]
MQHQLDGIACGIARHVVVDPSPCQDDLRDVADLLRLVGEIVRIDADAMSSDKAGPKRKKVPLASRRLKHVERVDPKPFKQDGKLIH